MQGQMAQSVICHLCVQGQTSPPLHRHVLLLQKWTPKLDQFLEEGVNQYGVGKWARILLDYDFEGRTGTMLKDRWRTLTKGNSTS